jgi:hypothetical protein
VTKHDTGGEPVEPVLDIATLESEFPHERLGWSSDLDHRKPRFAFSGKTRTADFTQMTNWFPCFGETGEQAELA